jgi:MFS family permease
MQIRQVAKRTFSSLRIRNFRLFFAGQLVSNTGNWLTNVALTLLILHLTNSGVAVGLLTTCQYGPILLLSIWAGTIADRSNKRNLLFITQSLEMAQSIALAALAFMHDPPIPALYATAAVGGILLAFDNPLRRSFVTEMVPAEERPNAVVLYSMIVNTSRIFGPTLAGLLVVTVGFGWCFTVDAFSYLFVIAALWMMRPSELHRVPPRPRTRGDARAALRYVRDHVNLRISFVLLAVIGTLSYNFTVTLPLFVTRSIGGTDGSFTFLYTVYSVGAVISGLVVANRRLVRLRHIVIGAAALGAATLILASVPSVAVAVPAVLLVGIASILYVTSTTAIVQVEADPSMHGRVLAIQTVLLVGTAPIGGPLLGALADALGARAPIIIGGLASLSGAAWAAVAGRRAYAGAVRATPAPAEAEAGVEDRTEPDAITSDIR